jgi:hypothetical protein
MSQSLLAQTILLNKVPILSEKWSKHSAIIRLNLLRKMEILKTEMDWILPNSGMKLTSSQPLLRKRCRSTWRETTKTRRL